MCLSSNLVNSKLVKLPARSGSDNDPLSDPSEAINTECQHLANRRWHFKYIPGHGTADSSQTLGGKMLIIEGFGRKLSAPKRQPSLTFFSTNPWKWE